jgi:surface-anchored protein
VDACASGAHDCAEKATCTNTPGSFECTCEANYEGDGRTCTLLPCLYEYEEGHGDIFVDDVEQEGLSLHVRSELESGEGELLYEPIQVCVHVPRAQYDTIVELGGRPSGAAWDFIGVAAGVPFWHLPQTHEPEVPFFGIAPESVPAGLFDTNHVTVTLERFEGPPGAHFSSWTTGAFGSPSPVFSTATDVLSSGRLAGSHAHMSWGFTEAGEYLATFSASGTRTSDGKHLQSPAKTFRFVVH